MSRAVCVTSVVFLSPSTHSHNIITCSFVAKCSSYPVQKCPTLPRDVAVLPGDSGSTLCPQNRICPMVMAFIRLLCMCVSALCNTCYKALRPWNAHQTPQQANSSVVFFRYGSHFVANNHTELMLTKYNILAVAVLLAYWWRRFCRPPSPQKVVGARSVCLVDASDNDDMKLPASSSV